jgi:hypothetical protein
MTPLGQLIEMLGILETPEERFNRQARQAVGAVAISLWLGRVWRFYQDEAVVRLEPGSGA